MGSDGCNEYGAGLDTGWYPGGDRASRGHGKGEGGAPTLGELGGAAEEQRGGRVPGHRGGEPCGTREHLMPGAESAGGMGEGLGTDLYGTKEEQQEGEVPVGLRPALGQCGLQGAPDEVRGSGHDPTHAWRGLLCGSGGSGTGVPPFRDPREASGLFLLHVAGPVALVERDPLLVGYAPHGSSRRSCGSR